MDRLRKNIRNLAVLLVIIFLIMIVYMIYDVIVLQNSLINSPYNGRMDDVRESTTSGSIYDRHGILLMSGDDSDTIDTETAIATCHLIGDEYGFCSAGAITQYASILLDYDRNIFEEIYNAISKDEIKGDDITLTIDANLNKYAGNLLDNYNGAVVVQNYKTGEILAMVSKPDFDPNAIDPQYPNGGAADESLVNRVTYGQYSPGSLFYLFTLGAAIEYLDDYDTKSYVCTGTCSIDSKIYQCDEPHGSITIEEAYLNDCKTVMARLGVEIGAAKLNRYASQLLFNKRFNYSNIYMTQSHFHLSFNEEDDGIANAAIGQHEDTVSPLHICMLFGAIANDGYLIDPMLIKKISERFIASDKYGMRVFSKDTINVFNEILNQSSDETQTDLTVNTDGINILGKSAKAIVHSEDLVLPNIWYAGFVDSEEHPLSITVIAENCVDESFSKDIAEDLLMYAIALGY